jgi:ferric-dicitrate binding protein FerR (iron transport regulator)
LLLEDHLKECSSCRKALEALKQGESHLPEAKSAVSTSKIKHFPFKLRHVWAIAAAILLVAGLTQWKAAYQYVILDSTALATVKSIEGTLYQVNENNTQPVSASAVIGSGQIIRTAKNSRALMQLADGSLVEMAPRSEFALAKKWDGLGVQLARGQIIVQAAKQHGGHLYVTTEDCKVSVIGTIFAVNSGLKGSRISVLEGQVRVAQANQVATLNPGEQVTTNDALGKTAIANEVAWSRDVARYLSFVQALKAVRDQVEQAGLLPGLRYSSRLLELVPADTVFYGAIPNVSRAMGESYRLFEQRMQENETLREWWTSAVQAKGGDAALKDAFNRIQGVGQYLGDELVVSMSTAPLLLAEVKQPEALRSQINLEIAQITQQAGGKPVVQWFENASAQSQASQDQHQLWLYMDGNILAASPNSQTLQALARQLSLPIATPFSSTNFGTRLKKAYEGGADWLMGVDLANAALRNQHSSGNAAKSSAKNDELARLGFSDLKFLILEHKEAQGHTDNRAMVTFDGPRRGLASWLAAPTPMGTLNFISPEASFVTGFVVKNPALMLDDIFKLAASTSPDAKEKLEAFQAERGINIREDLAAPLGGEFTISIDGPILPKPSWKLVFEVYDPFRLQQALQSLVNLANQEAQKQGKEGVQLTEQQISGRTIYTLNFLAIGTEVHYLLADGYCIAAPSQALLIQALQYHESQTNLAQSNAFKALLPRDGHQNFSGLVYHNLGPVIKPLAEWAGQLSNQNSEIINALSKDTAPSVLYFYGEEDQILVGSTSSLASLGLNLGTLMKSSALRGLPH